MHIKPNNGICSEEKYHSIETDTQSRIKILELADKDLKDKCVKELPGKF